MGYNNPKEYPIYKQLITHLSTTVTPFLDIQVAGIPFVYYTFLPGVSSVSFSENSGGLSSLLFPSSHELTTTQCREANDEVLLMEEIRLTS